MRRFPPSDDRLFSGDLNPDDASPELARIAGLIQTAKTADAVGELAGEELIVSRMAAVVRESRQTEAARNDRRHLLGKVLSAKVIGASAAVLLSGGVAAAATGALPSPVQEAVSHGLHHIGISVPDPAAHLASHSETHASGVTSTSAGTSSSTTSTTRPTSSANRYGLCTVYEHASNAKARSVALSKLTAVALAKGETVSSYCAGATPPSNSSGANPGSTHRPTTTTSVPSSTPGKSRGHGASGQGVQHRPTTTLPAKPSSSHRGTINKNTATGTTRNTTSKSTTGSSARSGSGHRVSTTTTTSVTYTTTPTSLPVTAQSHSSANTAIGKGVSSARTS